MIFLPIWTVPVNRELKQHIPPEDTFIDDLKNSNTVRKGGLENQLTPILPASPAWPDRAQDPVRFWNGDLGNPKVQTHCVQMAWVNKARSRHDNPHQPRCHRSPQRWIRRESIPDRSSGAGMAKPSKDLERGSRYHTQACHSEEDPKLQGGLNEPKVTTWGLKLGLRTIHTSTETHYAPWHLLHFKRCAEAWNYILHCVPASASTEK